MDITLLYNVFHSEKFGLFVAIYFFLTGLSAGSFVLSTLAYGFGIEKYKPLGKPGIILAFLLLAIAPLFLLLHAGQPFRALWHLFVYINPSSPFSIGTFLLILYPIICFIYGLFIFAENRKWAKVFGLIGIPMAISVHGYTGFILAFGVSRALWNSAMMPLLFLVSAMASGIALMVLVTVIQSFIMKKDEFLALLPDLGKMLAWVLVFDLFLTFSEIIVLLVSHGEEQVAAHLLLFGSFAPYFVGIETLLGKIIPIFILLNPRTRNTVWITSAAALVVIGIFAMRCNFVLGGEHFPLI